MKKIGIGAKPRSKSIARNRNKRSPKTAGLVSPCWTIFWKEKSIGKWQRKKFQTRRIR